MISQTFPLSRMRRNRFDPFTRRLTAETLLTVDQLIWPIFVCEGEGVVSPVTSMPGVFRVSVDQLGSHLAEAVDLKIPAIALFPVTAGSQRDSHASESQNPDNLTCRAARRVKALYPYLGIIGDLALDPYTDHGQDGLLVDGYVVNDATVDLLVNQAINAARAGVDIVAPSDMMDGRIRAIREGLDGAGLINTRILSYAAKYASAFYGPFRDALETGARLKGDKKTYQMNPANSDEALREVAQDLQEGADMVMVKPGMPYLDIVRRVRERFEVPTFAYQVSGEYAMLVSAFERGWLDRPAAILESLMAFRRSGCNAIVTYFALEAARLLINA